MPRPIRTIEIYLPLDYNDGAPIEQSKFIGLQRALLRRFGGVTSTQREFPLQGLWHSGRQIFQDRVVVLAAIDFQGETDFELFRYLKRLKDRLKRNFDQLELLITVQDLLAV